MGTEETTSQRSRRFLVADRLAPGGGPPHAALTVGTVLVATYALLAAGLVAAGMALTHIAPAMHWDHRMSAWFAGHRTAWLTPISYWGTFVANTLGVVVVAAFVCALLTVRGRGRAALLIMGGLVVELTAFLTANYVVRRPRPTVPHLGSTPSTFSFPSGHAAATVVLYGGLALITMALTRNVVARTLAWIVAVTFPAWVAFSRVYRGQHHMTDVAAGLLLGTGVLLCLHTVTLGTEPLGEGPDTGDERVDGVGTSSHSAAEGDGERPHLTVIGGGK